MVEITPTGTSPTTIQVAGAVASGDRTARTGVDGGTSAAAKLSAQKGAETVGKALSGAQDTFKALTALREEISKAQPQAGESLSAEKAAELNKKIQALRTQIDGYNTSATVGGNNLLSSDSGKVAINAKNGVSVELSGQTLNSQSLGLSDLKITDAQSLRDALGTVAKAAGQSQLSVFRLEAADGLTGSGRASPSSTTATVSRALANQLSAAVAAPQTGSNDAAQALDAARQALDALKNFNNADQYGAAGQGRFAGARPNPLLTLFS